MCGLGRVVRLVRERTYASWVSGWGGADGMNEVGEEEN